MIIGGAVTSHGLLSTTRGNIELYNAREVLQQGILHALAAASGCTLSPPQPDFHKTDWTFALKSEAHTTYEEAKIDVQLKATHTVRPQNDGDFGFKIDNALFKAFSSTKIHNPRLVFVLIAPESVDSWVKCLDKWTILRHSMYWINLYGRAPTGVTSTTVRIPYKQRVDPLELCRLLHLIGDGGHP
ncbi:protein of unknown function [Williamsia sterculiae]|uniref:DUF4365 domain-containing protein n=1 Tax=Williamsia sterculiae TaxID=1344003 RepID=A0A1N7CI41_9NOCA|nr:protein of unknown function [Williamsia sterculiae]